MNSYQTLSAYYDRFTDDVGYAQWAEFFDALFAREGVQPKLVLDLARGTRPPTLLAALPDYAISRHVSLRGTLRQALSRTMRPPHPQPIPT